MSIYKRKAALILLIPLGLFISCAERNRTFELTVVNQERLEGIKVIENSDTLGSTDSTGSFKLEVTRPQDATLVFSYEKEGYRFAPDTMKVPENTDENLEVTVQIVDSDYKKVSLKFSTQPPGIGNIEIYADNELFGQTDSTGALEVTRTLKKGATIILGYYQDSVALESQDSLYIDSYIQEVAFEVDVQEAPG